jgi:hypothetical protein
MEADASQGAGLPRVVGRRPLGSLHERVHREQFAEGSVAAQGRSLLLQIVGDHLHEACHERGPT